MRVMLKAHIDTPAGNEGLKSGALPQTVKSLMESLKPEAAYFGVDEGVRTCWMVFDLEDSSRMPPLLEDLFMQFHAEISVVPVMNADELAKGLSEMKATRS
ncbi:hypothetical protein [Streptomyces roseicoloratus]|uniref:Muconolactone isomerase domain-containing protein n=1 Tax=Streptomyces roseicoloratus TaxID=2508722 RepID=A0ABY9RSV6_9ACTN|nr:hypothetical protein [Streptomyces roseicoloratus]WMX44025.1 hypothetical protein RGF97_02935 [Streptomyces roseicoloratus]